MLLGFTSRRTACTTFAVSRLSQSLGSTDHLTMGTVISFSVPGVMNP